MMPDLGEYGTYVIRAYLVSFALIGGLVALSVWRARQARETLRRVEGREVGRDV